MLNAGSKHPAPWPPTGPVKLGVTKPHSGWFGNPLWLQRRYVSHVETHVTEVREWMSTERKWTRLEHKTVVASASWRTSVPGSETIARQSAGFLVFLVLQAAGG